MEQGIRMKRVGEITTHSSSFIPHSFIKTESVSDKRASNKIRCYYARFMDSIPAEQLPPVLRKRYPRSDGSHPVGRMR